MKRILALIALLMCLTGCSGIANRNNIINLLSAPRLSEGESRIITAVNEYTGRSISLKAPKNGDNISPVQIVNLDGDEGEEAVVLYTSRIGGTTVRVALLDKIEDSWTVLGDAEGYGSEVYKIDIVNISDKNKKQIAVGYTFADGREILLSIYEVDESGLKNIQTVPCQEYIVYDMTGDGMDDILHAGVNPQNRNVNIKILSAHYNNYLAAMGNMQIGVKNAEVTNIEFSHSDFADSDVIVIDYNDAYNRLYTQAVHFDGYNMKEIMANDVVQKMWYFGYPLISRDVNGDGYVETPTIIDDGTPDSNNLKHMEWTCFLKEIPHREFYGVCEANSGTYFPLPDEWLNNITLENGEEDDIWQVVQNSTGDVLVRFELITSSDMQAEKNTLTVSKGTIQVKLTFHKDVSPRQRMYISQGLMYLK